VITEEIPARVKADQAYRNAMKNSSKSAARLEHDRALQKVVIEMLSDHTELFKQFSDNPGFKKWLSDTMPTFGVTYEEAVTDAFHAARYRQSGFCQPVGDRSRFDSI
jgi:type I restriction enzyme, R subunit